MNFVGYDFVTIGNHEFDYGMFNLIERSADLNCHMYCCNLTDLKNNKNIFDSYKIMTFENYKVAFIGVSTPESIVGSNPKYFQDGQGNYIYSLCEDASGEKLYKRIQETIDEVRSQNVDKVILVGHLGMDGVTKRWKSETIISNISGIDALIDGHSHEVYEKIVKDKNGKDVILTQTGYKLENIGKLTISKDGQISTQLINEVEKADEKTEEFIKEKQKTYQKYLDEKISYTEQDLIANKEDGTQLVRIQETNLGDITTDAFRKETGSDIAIINAGALRDNILKGDITYNSLLKVFPFTNYIYVKKVSGQVIKDALEFSVHKYPNKFGGFLQVSGLTFSFDPNIKTGVVVDEKGNFVKVEGEYRVKDIKINGEKLDLNKMYTIASISYVLDSCGDGHVEFKNQESVLENICLEIDIFEKYLRTCDTKNYANPNGEGRIKIIGK